MGGAAQNPSTIDYITLPLGFSDLSAKADSIEAVAKPQQKEAGGSLFHSHLAGLMPELLVWYILLSSIP